MMPKAKRQDRAKPRSSTSAAVSPALRAFRRARAAWTEQGHSDEVDQALCDATYRAAEPVLTRAPRSWDDVVEAAEVVRSLEHAGDYDPSAAIEPLAAIHHDEAAQEALVRAVLMMAKRGTDAQRQ